LCGGEPGQESGGEVKREQGSTRHDRVQVTTKRRLPRPPKRRNDIESKGYVTRCRLAKFPPANAVPGVGMAVP
jgi:hypothetical protein